MIAEDVAFLDDGAYRYVAKLRGVRPPATSPVVQLIQGIYSLKPLQARRILRQRIYSTTRANEMELGMVRVAAKRLSERVELTEFPLGSRDLIEVNPRFFTTDLRDPISPSDRTDAGHMAFAQQLASQMPRLNDRRYLSNRPVAALLVGSNGALLAHACNTSSINRTLHAEVNLVQTWCFRTGRRLPAGATVFTTLKSCKMCAGMIWDAAEDPSHLRVIYAEDDPGSYAKSTVLTAGSLERKRACSGMGAVEACRVEYQL